MGDGIIALQMYAPLLLPEPAMKSTETIASLLHALLSNQTALAEAINNLADWVESTGSAEIAQSVRDRLKLLKSNEAVIGHCVKELMRG